MQSVETTWNEDDPTAEAEVDPTKEAERSVRLRALRDLEAAKARVERDARRVYDETREELIAKLLPVIDNLDRTIAAALDDGEAQALVEGARLVRAQLEGVLRGYGAERIDALDHDFDPSVHEAVTMVTVGDRRDHGRVIEQLEPGYKFGERLLRPAKVVVGRYTLPAVYRRDDGDPFRAR